MKLVFIGTYPPRRCGIGTFTNNLVKAITQNLNTEKITENNFVVAINDQDMNYDYPPEVGYIIKQNDQQDYLNAAQFINYSEADVCILQHEFGIFGGDSGVYILPFINRLQIPLIVTLHTVLREPTFTQKAIMKEISKKAHTLVVMSNRAVRFLTDIYNIPAEKIKIIEHGVTAGKVLHSETVRKKFNFEDKKVLFTFGLLSRNKGIETVIKALPAVIKKHKNVLYVILGKTHPHVIKANGEEYREYLMRLVKQNNLENHVYFNRNFVSEDKLLEYLHAIDIYITPYLNEVQITSGTLSYAIGAGVAVVSTPYWHAQELLADGRGVLFNFNDSKQLSQILIDLLDNPAKIDNLKNNAFIYGQKLKWPKIGARYLETAVDAGKNFKSGFQKKKTILDPLLLPEFSLDHLIRLTDDTGIVQHAKFGIPNLKEGYCLDDNSRALLTVLKAYDIRKESNSMKLMPIYLSFIHYMQNDDGTFRNFLSFNRNYLDEVGSEDSFGRTIWALGYLMKNSPNDSYHQLGKEIFSKSVNQFENLVHIRGIANTIIGMAYYLKIFPTDEVMISRLINLSDKLMKFYFKNSSEEWKWVEDILTYDNGIIPLALFHTAEILKDEKILTVAKDMSEFLEKVTMKEGYFTPVGSNGWYRQGGQCARFAQQSIDTMSMVLMYYRAFTVLKDKKYLEKMFKCYMWFLGENDLRIPLYDFETAGCNDGLEEFGVNRNQGAESTIAYLLSHLTVLDAFRYEHEYSN
jgi:glycosyltransferase involved in cell wall biosynthesis